MGVETCSLWTTWGGGGDVWSGDVWRQTKDVRDDVLSGVMTSRVRIQHEQIDGCHLLLVACFLN